ncbi:MAG TPA: glycosyltransferase family 39 protein, partial [Candidatus Limnocylindria bacterium]|nr:glycosyltransferase family 39 protein [Candidatus Limnocylindria bacterium]
MTETPGRMAPTTDRGLSPVCLGIWSAQARHTLLDGTALLLVMLAAGVLRFVMLDARELFRDEAGSWLLASAAWHEIVPRSAAEPYAPVYQFLLKAWMSLFGDSHAALRALSGAAGLMLVGVTWAWARQALGSSVPAVIAAGLVALSPLALANSRDVRMYGLEALLILLAWWLLWRLLADRRPLPQRWAAILLAAAAVAAELWTLPTGVAAFALQLAVVGILQLRAPHLGVRAGGLALAAGLVAFLPGIPRMLDAASVQQPYWTPTP